MKTYLQEGMIIKPNENHMEYYFNEKMKDLELFKQEGTEYLRKI